MRWAIPHPWLGSSARVLRTSNSRVPCSSSSLSSSGMAVTEKCSVPTLLKVSWFPSLSSLRRPSLNAEDAEYAEAAEGHYWPSTVRCGGVLGKMFGTLLLAAFLLPQSTRRSAEDCVAPRRPLQLSNLVGNCHAMPPGAKPSGFPTKKDSPSRH